MTTDSATRRRFYLVQRIKRSRLADEPLPAGNALARMRNPFGYGQLGDYDLDYMGAAEFEWGAIPEAFDRLAKAGKGLALGTFEYDGHELDFLWIKKEGEPFEDWVAWAEGKPFVDEYGYECTRRPFSGKEPPHELRDRLDGRPEPDWGWRTDVWWALGENVLWAFHEDGHLQRMVESMHAAPVKLRG